MSIIKSKESDNRYIKLFENLSSGCGVYRVINEGKFGKDYIIEAFNKKSLELENKTSDEVVGKSLYDLRPNIDEYGLIEIFRNVWKTGEIAFYPVKVYHDDNYSNYYENRVFKLEDDIIVALYNDVTDYMQVQANLENSNKKLEMYFNVSPYGIFIADNEGKYVDVNEEACKLTGYCESELLGMHLENLIAKEDTEKARKSFTDLNNVVTNKTELRYITKKGNKRIWTVKASKLDENRYIGFVEDITESRRLEEQLDYERNRANKYLSIANILFLSLDRDGNIESINKKGCNIIGLEEKDVLGKNWFDNFLPKDDLEIVKNVFERIISGEIDDMDSYQNSIINSKGEKIIISWQNTILKNEEDYIIGILSSGIDVTEKVKSENKLVESEERYKLLYTSMSQGIALHEIITDNEGNPIDYVYLDINDSYTKLLGVTREMAIGKKITEVMPKVEQYWIDVFGKVALTGESFYYENYLETTNKYYATYTYSPKERQFAVLVTDITERKKAEEMQLRSERRLKAAQTMAKVGNWELDLTTNMIWASEEAIDIYGFDKNIKVITLDNIQERVFDEYKRLLKNMLNSLINRKEPYDVEFKIRSEITGEAKFIHSKAELEIDEYGNAIKVIGTIQDITQRKILEIKNEATQSILINHQKLESIGTLASGVAHEINNPINGILNYGQLILDSNSKDKNIEEYASEIIHETNRVAEIVKNLLEFSRQNEQLYSYVGIKDIISKTLSLIKTILKHDQIELNINIAENLPLVNCQNQKIQQVIMNLVTNARDALNSKYTGYNENKKINISCTQYNYDGAIWVKLIVEDLGVGIPKKTLSRIFDPFYTTKGKSEGTGLGLSISYGLINEHHGEIVVESEEGKYSRFIVKLPCDI